MACPSCIVGLMGTEVPPVEASSAQTAKVVTFVGLAAIIALLAYTTIKGKK